MSNARKLQTEIDRVLKKVDEGAELFNEISTKVRAADSQNLKEKHEADLKKEIKKLQRLRDQIKTWLSSTEVKDKEALLEARKLIESKMEEFKVCEKETKTKTYSKEGLLREDKIDPEEEAKMNTTSWLQEYVEKFQQHVEEKDFEIEKLSSGKGKKTNKHLLDELLGHIKNHKFHINKLEGIIRLVNNDVLNPDAVDAIRDDLDYYLESYQESDYKETYDEEALYETLGLEELDVVQVVVPPKDKKANDETTSTSSKGSNNVINSKKGAPSSVIPLTIGRARTKAEKKLEEEKVATPVKKSPAPQPKPVPAQPVRVASSTPSVAGESMAAILKREGEQQEKERLKQQQEIVRQQQLKQQEVLRQEQEAREKEAEQQRQEQQETLRQQQAAAAQQLAQQEALKLQQLQAHARSAAEQASVGIPPPAVLAQPTSVDAMTMGIGSLSIGASDNRSTATDSSTVMGSVAQSMTNAKSTVSDNSGASSYLSAINDSFVTAPGTNDAERSKQYQPQNPYPTPASYPSAPSAIFENPAVFEKLGTDCLFFIFYYAQGTYQQYLAARELKKQSWRFHKKYMAWFQRHEEPKITTDEYEQGTYVYFDYETGWCQRIKQDFRFEYSYLEDSLQ